MKTLEEKAKAYDEALERASKLRFQNPFDTVSQMMEHVFHELKESEDERIRKAIITFFESEDDNTTYTLVPKKDILAWLEKQGEIDLEHYKDGENEKREFVGYGFLKCKGDFLSFKEGETYWLEYVGKDNYNVRSDNLLGQTFHITPQQLYTVFRPTTWLEKQGENISLPKFTFDDILALQCCMETVKKVQEDKDLYEKLNDLHGRVYDAYHLENQGEQKSADKVEPKFKAGDWITENRTNNDTIQINSVDDRFYWHDDNRIGGRIDAMNKAYHLWSINDAKDGDVLACKIDGDSYILIYKQIKDGWIETYGHYYNAVDRFCVPSQMFCRDYQGALTPATKEQCDLLFNKMKEAGYEWDAEKKELEKIEQKPKWSEEDSLMIDSIIDTIKWLEGKGATNMKIDWLKSLKQRMEQ